MSGKQKEHKLKLLGPDILQWGGGLPHEGVGAKKFGVSLKAQGKQTFWQDILAFLPGHPWGRPKSLKEKGLRSILVLSIEAMWFSLLREWTSSKLDSLWYDLPLAS